MRVCRSNEILTIPIAVALAVIFAPCYAPARSLTLDDISPHFSTNMPILWRAPMSQLPNSFWIYKKLPRVFSAATISNAIALTPFQKNGFPKPSTNIFSISADSDGVDEPSPPCFSIFPNGGQISFTLGDRKPKSETILSDERAVQQAWDCLFKLGLDRSQFRKTNAANTGIYGVFLPRQIDGVQIFNALEGFQFQCDSRGKVLEFGLLFPKLERVKQDATATPHQIIACIHAFKTALLPDDAPNYFARIKNLANAQKLTIRRITPLYTEGNYGETPKDNEHPTTLAPIAQLEAVANFETSNVVVQLLSPVLLSQANRLVSNKKFASEDTSPESQ